MKGPWLLLQINRKSDMSFHMAPVPLSRVNGNGIHCCHDNSVSSLLLLCAHHNVDICVLCSKHSHFHRYYFDFEMNLHDYYNLIYAEISYTDGFLNYASQISLLRKDLSCVAAKFLAYKGNPPAENLCTFRPQ